MTPTTALMNRAPPARASVAGRVSAMGVATLSALIIRFLIPPTLLNAFEPYTMPGGSLFVKIHPGSYLLFALTVASFFREAPAESARSNRGLWLYSAGIAVAVAMAAASGGAAAGYLLDSMICAVCAAWTVSRLSWSDRQLVLTGSIIAILVNGGIVLAEFATKQRLVAYVYRERYFRPAGLLDHPLSVGLFNATAVPACLMLKWRPLAKIGAILLLTVSAFAAGARIGSIGALVFAAVAISVVTRAELRKSGQTLSSAAALALLATPPVVAAGAVMLLTSPLLYRFQSEFFDQSASTRLDIYRLLNYLEPREFWLGSSIERLNKLNFLLLKSNSVESPVVMSIFQYGIVATVALFGGLFVGLLLYGTRRGFGPALTALAFLLVANSNNAITVKTGAITFVFTLLATHAASRGASGRPVR